MRVANSKLWVIAVAASSLMGTAAGHAAVIYQSGGFENDRFHIGFTNVNDPSVVGNLRGQDGLVNQWLESSQTPNGPSTPDGGGTATGTAVVETKAGGSGLDLQDIKVTRTQYDNRWFPSFNYIPSPADHIVDISWDMKVTQTTTDLDKFGPFFGIEANDDHTGPAFQIGDFGVDSTTGEVLFMQPGFGLNITPADDTVNFDVYNHFDLIIDYNAGTYSGKLNGNTLVSNVAFYNGVATELTDADISALQASDDADSNLAGVAYFDNYSVVPEPASLGLIAVGALAFIRRRRSI